MTAYIINHYNGSSLATVADGTANSSATSLTLIGHALTNYGTALNENFVYLLENFSNSAGNYPPNPVQGQLWWDNTFKYLNVYDGTTWRTVYGALGSLTVNGAVAFSSLTASNGGQVSGYLTGAIGANTPNSGAFTTITTTSTINSQGTIASPTINANVVGNVGSSHYGVISTNAQPYITSVGTLSSISSSGNITAQTANVYGANHIANTATYSSAYYFANGTPFVSSNYGNSNVASYLGAVAVSVVPSANASLNLGSTGSGYWNNVYAVNFLGTSTTAKYADLAEKYLPDADYDVGTVMMVGGAAEITKHSGAKVRAIGVISAYPAYKMNSDLDGGVYVALKGRVPVKVVGPVTKGQSLIGTAHGLAVAQTDDSQWMFGIALEDYSDSGIGLIEAIII